jgi:hypothetical protein
VTLNCTASDKDDDVLTYSWSSSCDKGNGVFGVPDPSDPSAITWMAPAAASDKCSVTCTVCDGTTSTSGELDLTTAPVSLSSPCGITGG